MEALKAAAATDQGVVLVQEEDRETFRSYAELYQSALSRAAALRHKGLEPGQRLVVVLNTSFEFIEVFFGVMLAGGVPVPAYPPLAMSRMSSYLQLLSHIANVTGARFLVTDRTIGAALGTLYQSCPALDQIIHHDQLKGDPRWGKAASPAPDSTCFIQCTSGSTSSPKAVVLKHKALMVNIRGIAHGFQLRDDDVFVSWLPLYHDLGLIGALLGAICRGIRMVLLPPNLFIWNPAAWWRAISRNRGTVTAGPNFSFGLSLRRLDKEDLEQLDLSSLRAVLSGAEPIQPDMMRRFTAVMSRAGLDPRAFFPAYGLAESCVAVTFSPLGRGLAVERISRDALAHSAHPRAVVCDDPQSVECVSVGFPILGTTIRILDSRGRELPQGCVGEITVEGPSLMAGYLDDPEATAAVLQGGALHTGDLGYLRGGELFIAGRLKDMLIVRGKNYFAEDIEAAVEKVHGVRKGNAVAFGSYDPQRGQDQLHLAVETRLRDEPARQRLEQQIRKAVSEEVGLVPAEVTLLRPGSIPKTSSGKKRRKACGQAVTSGEIFRQRGNGLALAGWLLFVSQLARALRPLTRALSHKVHPAQMALDR